MILWSFTRRILVKPRLIPMNLDAGLILGAIGSLMVTHFIFHGYELAQTGTSDWWMPLSNVVNLALSPLTPEAAHRGAMMGYWLHVLILLTFLNYLPYSKHIHLLGALPNIFTRNRSARRMDLPKVNLEDETQWGVGKYEQFSWKSLLDTYACTECARCTNYCPAYNTGKNLSPMQLVHDIRYEMLDRVALKDRIAEGEAAVASREQFVATHGGEDPHHPDADLAFARQQLADAKAELDGMQRMTGGRIQEDTLWACTTCGACQEVCPVFIDHPEKILQMRQNLVLVQEKVPPDLARTFTNLERNGNPWGIGADKRMDWAEGHDVPTLDDKPDAEYLLWVGCAGAYDDRIKKQTLALVDVLREGGVHFAVLGLEEGCTGDPARRSGNEMLYQMQAQQNVETMNAKKVKKVITACPHCLHTIKNEYPQLGGNFEVRHHTQVIRELVESGKVEIDKAELASEDRAESGAAALSSRKIAFHDPCYLGRWNGEYDAPRAVLDGLPPRTSRIELSRNKEHGFCCGAGGGRMWMEEKIGTRVNHNRTDEIIASGADTVATACPFCTIMLRDGVQDRGAGEKVQVLNVSELVAKSMKRKRELEGSGALQGAKSPSE
jgi:Fe-S oxidoreductase